MTIDVYIQGMATLKRQSPAQSVSLPIQVPASARPVRSAGKVYAYATRKRGTEWPSPGWSSNETEAAKFMPPGHELVRITVEPV